MTTKDKDLARSLMSRWLTEVRDTPHGGGRLLDSEALPLAILELSVQVADMSKALGLLQAHIAEAVAHGKAQDDRR